jgi:hypothetical protein
MESSRALGFQQLEGRQSSEREAGKCERWNRQRRVHQWILECAPEVERARFDRRSLRASPLLY